MPGDVTIIGTLMLESFGLSDPGLVRANNEDSLLIDPALGLYLVADGMGGAQAGEEASRLAVRTVVERIRDAAERTGDVLLSAIESANRAVLDAAAQDAGLDGMGTTLTAAMQLGNEVLVANVGDSRAYVFRHGELRVVTEDQTWINEVGRPLGITEDALLKHPLRHALTMAIGVAQTLRIHSYAVPLTFGTQILLCSDGLHGVVPIESLSTVLAAESSIEEKCHSLIDAARQAGGPDNITAVILRACDRNLF